MIIKPYSIIAYRLDKFERNKFGCKSKCQKKKHPKHNTSEHNDINDYSMARLFFANFLLKKALLAETNFGPCIF